MRLRPRGARAHQWRFAKPANPWENASMRKLSITALNFLAAGLMLPAIAQAQQTPAANTKQAPPAKAAPAPAAGAQKAPAAKTGPAAKPRTEPGLTLKTQKDKVSYALGAHLGMDLHKQVVEGDPSYKRGQAACLPVNGVIKGWTEALKRMRVGAKWQLFVPAELGYGDRGAGADIGPSATLIFEVELLSIQGKDKSEVTPK